MNLYLSPELRAHRRGRFLASLLAIAPTADQELPKNGLALMTGEHFQASQDLQPECVAWARQPGCALLLLPPYRDGRIFPALDWVVELVSSTLANVQQASLESILAAELSYRLQGMDGACISGQSLGDLACHTRFWKAHSNSGQIAATTLPLWSISLLDHADKVLAFLTEFDKHTGMPSATIPKDESQEALVRPQDLTVLVCCYGYGLATAEDLLNRLGSYEVPFLNLASFDLPESIRRLQGAFMLNDKGVTETGLAVLQASNYWAFAENLKEEA